MAFAADEFPDLPQAATETNAAVGPLQLYGGSWGGFSRQLRDETGFARVLPEPLAERTGCVFQSLFVAGDQFFPDGILFGVNQLAPGIGVEPGQRLANSLCKSRRRHVI